MMNVNLERVISISFHCLSLLYDVSAMVAYSHSVKTEEMAVATILSCLQCLYCTC